MKFASRLQTYVEYSPTIREVHTTYKAAKKLVNAGLVEELSTLLQAKATEWNDYFLDTEETLVIECSELQSACKEWDAQAANAKRESQLEFVKGLVDYHGRLVLFLHWCLLAHTALAKILKKCAKKLPGRFLQAPQLHSVMQDHTCCSTDVSSQLCATIEALITKYGAPLGVSCAAGPAFDPLLQGCCTAGRTADSIQRAVEACKAALLSGQQQGASGSSCSSAAAGPGMIQQLSDAVLLWEQLKSTARTPSTVLSAEQLPPAAAAAAAAAAGAQQCCSGSSMQQ